MGGDVMGAVAKAAVIGAGSMGSGIAAQFANAGVPVVLLDVPSEGGDPDRIAKAGVERQLKSGGFMHPDRTRLVTTGNTRDHLHLLADADWIVEAVIENLEIKRDLYRRLDAVRKDGSLVSSNTSTIPLAQLTEGLSERFAGDFVITHFFNPPRHMRLVEVVEGPKTHPEAAARVRAAADRHLGKVVIDCRDTPGFIANRIGCYWMSLTVLEAFDLGLSVEEADAIAGTPFGVPRTGIFGLFDLVGIDLIPLVWPSLLGALPASDGHQRYRLTEQPLLQKMIADGYTGRKGKGGFYRIVKDGKERRKEVLDLATGSYRAEEKPNLASLEAVRDLKRLVEVDDRGGRYAWRVLANLITYAATVAEEIADDVAAIDTGMELGYNWSAGPFALADKLGCQWLADKLAADGRSVPPLLAKAAEAGGFHRRAENTVMATSGGFVPARRPEGIVSLADIRRHSKPILSNDAASLWDLGDGVACFEIHTKMNIVTHEVLDLIEETVASLPRRCRALVIGNEDPRAFSVGANLAFVAEKALGGDIEAVNAFIARGQKVFRALRHSPFPVVGAAAGMAFGGGCEILLHCDAIQAHAEVNMGLVETRVGIIPGWGGCARLLERWTERTDRPGGPLPPSTQAFEVIATAKVSQSALDARDMGFLRPSDGITMNRDRLLADAKAKALALVDGYQPPTPALLTLTGPSGKLSLMNTVTAWQRQGVATPHDETVLGHLAAVLTGGDANPNLPVEEDTLYRLEREAVATLARLPETQARVEHMLKTGKPLRN